MIDYLEIPVSQINNIKNGAGWLKENGEIVPHEELVTPADPVRENEVAATCEQDGSFDEVVYCTVCGKELSREKQIIPGTGPVLTGTVKGNELTYSIANLPEGARLIAARFDGGRLTAVKVVDDPGASGKVDLNGTGNAYKLFLVSSAGMPLCPAWNN